MSRAFFLVSAAVSTAMAVIACTTDYQKGLDDPNYGTPNALAGQQPPSSSVQVNAANSGATSASEPLCVADGGTLADGGTCSVSFAKDILPALATAGCAAVSCHGGKTPTTDPPIDTTNASATWTSLSQFTTQHGKTYVDPCSLNPDDSEFAYNLDKTADPLKAGPVMPQGGNGLPALVPTVTTWVKCGAPNN